MNIVNMGKGLRGQMTWLKVTELESRPSVNAPGCLSQAPRPEFEQRLWRYFKIKYRMIYNTQLAINHQVTPCDSEYIANVCQGFDHLIVDECSEKPQSFSKRAPVVFLLFSNGESSLLPPKNEGTEKVMPRIPTGIGFIIDNLTHLSLIFIL